MEHHKLAWVAMVVSLIFVSITLSPALASITIYFYLIGWFTNKNELITLSAYLNKYLNKIGFGGLTLTPKSVFKWGLTNLGVQFVLALVCISFSWSILIVVLFSTAFVLGISSTEKNLETVIKNLKSER